MSGPFGASTKDRSHYVFFALLGLMIGGVVSLASLAGAGIEGRGAGPDVLLFGVGVIVITPVFYGVIGFLAGIIMAALYNVVASIVGGIEIELNRMMDHRAE